MSSKSKIAVMVALLGLLYPGALHAIMPPEHYAEIARQSDIKAIAVIIKVDPVHLGKQATTKKVTFKTDHALTEKTDALFTGTCKSVDTPEQEANFMVGGQIYLYPVPGQRVFVTVSNEGGSITSLTSITKELEHVIREDPEHIHYGIARVGVKRGDGN